jgi:hypothetical protein
MRGSGTLDGVDRVGPEQRDLRASLGYFGGAQAGYGPRSARNRQAAGVADGLIGWMNCAAASKAEVLEGLPTSNGNPPLD